MKRFAPLAFPLIIALLATVVLMEIVRERGETSTNENWRQDSELNQLFSELPRRKDLRAEMDASPEIVTHGFSSLLLDAGYRIGALADLVRTQKLNVDAAVGFYKACAQADDIAKSIRAVCLRELRVHHPNISRGHLRVPLRIRLVANKL